MTIVEQQLPVTYVPNPNAADGADVELFTLNGSPVYTGSDITVSGGGGGSGGSGSQWIPTPGASPNSLLTAVQGGLATDANGALWIKTSGSNTNTGWEQRL